MNTDQTFCAEMLPLVSRTFALSIEALPGLLREPVRAAYLLCRMVDTVEDGNGVCFDDRVRLFALFDRAVADDDVAVRPFVDLCTQRMDGVESAERRLCHGADRVFRVFRALPDAQREAIRPHLQEMSRGMQEYVRRAEKAAMVGLRSMEDLERYCYFVAGTVGKLLTALFFQLVPTLDDDTRRSVEARAVSFGLGLQMVNIVKDVAADSARGSCFLPLPPAGASGLVFGDLLDPGHREGALRVVRAICSKAREHLVRAQEYTELWPVPDGIPIRLFCAVPLALALATLDEVEHGQDTLHRNRNPKVSRESVARILHDAQGAVTSNDALDRLFGTLSRPPAALG
jgi:farnesyl-diphosphate farnesyltransferase